MEKGWRKIPGIHVREPWSQYIIFEKKVVETRSYPLPSTYLNREIAIIETYGSQVRKKARIVGTVIFSECFEYESFDQWKCDQYRHLVEESDSKFGFIKGKPKFGWVISSAKPLTKSEEPPKIRGIKFVGDCQVSDDAAARSLNIKY